MSGLKKVPDITAKEKRALIETGHIEIPISRQCELLGLSRSGYYYEPQGESSLNLHLMNLVDEYYTKMPFYGVNKITAWLNRQGHYVNVKRIRRLMRKMRLEAIYPKRNLNISASEHKRYPHLLRDLAIEHPDRVWCADITYIRMAQGFLYLIAIMDWYSRYVLSWRLSNILDAMFCIEALEAALAISQPDIFNTDQGVQFTGKDFTGRLETAGIKVSMDGRGRVFDNIFIERLWRSVRYEEVYAKNYESIRDAIEGLTRYFQLYNKREFTSLLDTGRRIKFTSAAIIITMMTEMLAG